MDAGDRNDDRRFRAEGGLNDAKIISPLSRPEEQGFMNDVIEHLKKEESFHDDWAKTVDPASVQVKELACACTMPETRAILKELGDLKGKRVVELGCGCGEASVYFATQGADVTATDLSSGMLDLARRTAEHHGVAVKTHQCSAEETNLPSESFDVVYAANLLHHVNVENTVKEAYRLLKPGGVFAAWDPLAYNPLINVYRKIAVKVRTEDERPLRRKDVAVVQKYFGDCKTSGYWFFTLFIFLKFFFIDRVDPNKERYWKKIINEHEALKPIYAPLEFCDRALLTIFPFLKWMCWNVSVVGRKK